jgi:hypothetical protein
MMSAKSGLNAQKGNRQTATATHTPTAAETSFTTVAATLPGGAVGRPIKLLASGSVGGLVQITFGSQAAYTIPVAPNQLPVVYEIPKSAFPNQVGSVNVQFEGFGAGTLVGIVEFEVN